MCSLCGVLGGRGHWTDSAATPDAFANRTEPATRPSTRRAERQQRTRLANRVLAHYGLTLSDWGGSGYVLATRTGRTALVDNLTEIWAAAEDLAAKDCDPLDDRLLADLADRGGQGR